MGSSWITFWGLFLDGFRIQMNKMQQEVDAIKKSKLGIFDDLRDAAVCACMALINKKQKGNFIWKFKLKKGKMEREEQKGIGK